MSWVVLSRSFLIGAHTWHCISWYNVQSQILLKILVHLSRECTNSYFHLFNNTRSNIPPSWSFDFSSCFLFLLLSLFVFSSLIGCVFCLLHIHAFLTTCAKAQNWADPDNWTCIFKTHWDATKFLISSYSSLWTSRQPQKVDLYESFVTLHFTVENEENTAQGIHSSSMQQNTG